MADARPSEKAVASLVAVRPRIDLRTGRCVSGRIEAPQAATAKGVTRVLAAARGLWREHSAPLALPLGSAVSTPDAGAALDQAAREAGLGPGALTFELEERAVIARAAPLADELRGRGWRVGLRADAACPLPFGARARTLYQEVIFGEGLKPSLFLGIDAPGQAPLGRRLMAAREAGLALVAEGVDTLEAARLWGLAGFDAAEGAFCAPARQAQTSLYTRAVLAGRSPRAFSFSSR